MSKFDRISAGANFYENINQKGVLCLEKNYGEIKGKKLRSETLIKGKKSFRKERVRWSIVMVPDFMIEKHGILAYK